MAELVEVKAVYTGDADEIFKNAISFRELKDAMRGLATYEGDLPETGKVGETYSVDVTMWGFLKTKAHTIHIESLSMEKRYVQSREHSNHIKKWDHLLKVDQQGQDAVWTDSIVIDASWRTFVVARFASYVYQYRHKHRNANSISCTIKKHHEQ